MEAVALLEKGAVEQVGWLLWQSHEGLRDEYEVSCAELDALVEIARQVPGVLGARMMGGGFGGCTINLVRNEAVEQLRRRSMNNTRLVPGCRRYLMYVERRADLLARG